MKALFILLLSILTGLSTSKAQEDSSRTKQHIYLEGLGNGILYSFNYDINNTWAGARVGLTRSEQTSTILQGYVLIGKKKSKIELGFGAIIWPDNAGKWQAAPNGAMMFRYESTSGLLFRVGITSTSVSSTPDFVKPETFLFWPGISIGLRV